jgi:hypothetical protein
MRERSQVPRLEPRWHVALAIVAVVALIACLPGRVQLLPGWVPFLLGVVVLVPMVAVALTAGGARWSRLERTVTLGFSVVAGFAAVATLANLVVAMVRRSADIGGLQLLSSSVALWVSNVLVFSLLYWQLDRGGPVARLNDAEERPDWLFPQEGASPGNVRPDWRPAYVDYLYLGYSTATAFSTTDAMPLTSRAKLLMMLESTISLVTIVVVASRAINVLGG